MKSQQGSVPSQDPPLCTHIPSPTVGIVVALWDVDGKGFNVKSDIEGDTIGVSLIDGDKDGVDGDVDTDGVLSALSRL